MVGNSKNEPIKDDVMKIKFNFADCLVTVFLFIFVSRMFQLVMQGDIAYAVFTYLFVGLAFYIEIMISIKQHKKNIKINPIKVILLWFFMTVKMLYKRI